MLNWRRVYIYIYIEGKQLCFSLDIENRIVSVVLNFGPVSIRKSAALQTDLIDEMSKVKPILYYTTRRAF